VPDFDPNLITNLSSFTSRLAGLLATLD